MIDIKSKIIEDLSEYGTQCYEEGKIQGRADGVRDFLKGKDFAFEIKNKQAYNQALEDAEKRYREWSKSEYGKVVADDVLPIRVLRSLRIKNF